MKRANYIRYREYAKMIQIKRRVQRKIQEDPSRSQQAWKRHRSRSKKDPMGVHGHWVQLEKRSGRGDDKVSEAHPGPRTGQRGQAYGLP